MVKKSRIMTLVLAAAVLAVVASGTAFAQNCYSGTDTSHVYAQYGDYFPAWDSSASGSPSVSAGTLVEWKNTLTNNDPSHTFVPGVQYWDTTRSATTKNYGSSLGYGDSWVTYQGHTQTQSGSYTGIYHLYVCDQGGNTGISQTNNQHSWTV